MPNVSFFTPIESSGGFNLITQTPMLALHTWKAIYTGARQVPIARAYQGAAPGETVYRLESMEVTVTRKVATIAITLGLYLDVAYGATAVLPLATTVACLTAAAIPIVLLIASIAHRMCTTYLAGEAPIGQAQQPVVDIRAGEREIIQTTLEWTLSDETLRAFKSMSKENIALAIQELRVPQVLSQEEKQFFFLQHGIDEAGFDWLRQVFTHPCPQNRTTGRPVLAGGNEDGILDGMVHFAFGPQGHERQGLLGLTSRPSPGATPITKEETLAIFAQLLSTVNEWWQDPEPSAAAS